MERIGKNVFLRFYQEIDAAALLDLHLRNSEFFQKYSPTFSDDYYTIQTKRSFISHSITQRVEDQCYNFGIFLKEDGSLVGDVSLYRIFRGPLQRSMIGYSLDQAHNGKGFATEAVGLAVEFAFNDLRLHRVEAGVMPSNPGSIRLLEKNGFQKEGIERKGVKINGQWEDHQILAILSNKH